MKIAAATISTVLALLLAGAAEAQTQAQRTPPGATRPAMVGKPPVPVTPPSFVRPPFFFRHPFFFGSGLLFTSPAASVPQTYVYSYAYPVYVQSPVYDQPQTQYWAYCRSPQGYYPYVSECPAGWLPVAPTSPPPPLVPVQTSLDAGKQPREARSGGDSIEEIRARIARSRAD
jgi:hypothetical protein